LHNRHAARPEEADITRVDEFNSFYASTFAQAVRVTYAICGDRHVAFEATTDAYRRAWRDWSKIRDRHPLGYVRTEAWKLTALSRGTHPLRRRHEEDSDEGLLEALADLSVDDRRLIVLMTLGDTDLEEASREVGVPAEEGIENVTTALSALETSLGQSIDEIERRMHALASVTDSIPAPPAKVVRDAARRRRQRNTFALVGAAVVLVLTGGVVATDGDALAERAAVPYREKIGAERADIVLDAEKLDTDDLLSAKQVSRLDPTRKWTVEGTDEDVDNTLPYATCPTKRFATKDPLKAFVRTYQAGGQGNQRVAQAIEVARSDKQAEDAYGRMLRWYADCAHPRVQLVAAYTVNRPFGDFQILHLQSHRSPERSMMVGFSHSGTVTSTLVHEGDGEKAPSVESFARTLNDSVSRVCNDSGGRCTDTIEVTRVEPPRTTKAPAFLGIVDLPPIAQIDRVWAGVEPFDATTNPSATVCDSADFTGKSVEWAKAKIFVIPGATELPKEFGVAETVGRFSSDDSAKAFVKKIGKRVQACPKTNLSAKIDQKDTFESDNYSGTSWRVGLEVTKGKRVYYRMALVRRGANVAQVTFTPAGDYDISADEFAAMAARAGARMRYLE
jgi:DNA-directed RNA polymerase specialized sigma24 family protein